MKRISLTILAALVVCSLAWFGGFDFNERGPAGFFVAYAIAVVALVTYALAGSKA